MMMIILGKMSDFAIFLKSFIFVPLYFDCKCRTDASLAFNSYFSLRYIYNSFDKSKPETVALCGM